LEKASEKMFKTFPPSPEKNDPAPPSDRARQDQHRQREHARVATIQRDAGVEAPRRHR